VPAAGVPNRVQLITYPDSLGGDLPTLVQILDEEFPGLFPGGIHLLPPFPSSGDRGFAPIRYDEIDPRFGSWADIHALGERAPVMLDLMVNHASARSPQFLDYLAQGSASPWADLFIPLRKIWPGGDPDPTDLARLFLRREHPWSTYEIGEPSVSTRVWTTFGKTDPSEQVDLDWRSREFGALVEEHFARFAANGVRMVRLDAVGYLAKRAGTSCFMVQPDTDEILAWLEALAADHGITLLPEVHAKPSIARALSARGSWSYDFILPYRILEALILRRPERLATYLADRPSHCFTMLDCHDGIPLKPDLDGLYDPDDARTVVGACLARGGNLSRVVAREHQDPDGFDAHQIRGTLYSLLGRDDDALVAARALQLFAPGIPQVYYVGLLAGENDQAAGERTGDGREINRHNYTRDEVRAARRRPVVARIERLIRLRNSHPAFAGRFTSCSTDGGVLRLVWQAGDQRATLDVDVRESRSHVEVTDDPGGCERLPI
jgi:sucrose 6(F)-phosphate phosphorylase